MNTAFVGLDYIHDITHPDGRIARSAGHVAERGVIAAANGALALAKKRGWLSALVKVGFAPGYPEQPKRSPLLGRAHESGALNLTDAGTGVHPDLHADLADLVVVKPRMSASHGTPLDGALRAHRVERLIVAGVSSSWAVQSTMRDAHDRDSHVIVVEDACAAADDAEHQASMNVLKTIARIATVRDLEAAK